MGDFFIGLPAGGMGVKHLQPNGAVGHQTAGDRGLFNGGHEGFDKGIIPEGVGAGQFAADEVAVALFDGAAQVGGDFGIERLLLREDLGNGVAAGA